MGTEIDRLVVVWDANYKRLDDKLNKVIRSNYGAADRVEKRWKSANDNVAKGFANKRVSDALEGLSSRAGSVTAGFNAFGLAGLAAGASLGVLALAASRATEAMGFAAQLTDTSERIGITTEGLQEMRFAFDEAGIEIGEGEKALEGLNGALGAFKTGVGSGRITKVFKALGITKTDLVDVHDANGLLPILADRLGKVGTTAEQVNLAKRLGIEALLPLLRRGSDGISELRQQAHELGLVLSNETVRSLDEADRKMELAGQTINTILRAAFADTAVAIADGSAKLAEFVGWLGKMKQESPEAMKWLSRFLYAAGAANMIPGGVLLSKAFKPKPEKYGGPASMSAIKSRFGVVDADGGFNSVEDDDGKQAAADAKARRDRERRIAQEISRAQLDELDIHNDSRRSAEDRLGFGLERLDLEKRARDAELDALRADYDRTAGKEGISAAEREQLETVEAAVRAGKQRNLEEATAREIADARYAAEERLAGYALEMLGYSADAARTASERLALERQMLIDARAEGRRRLEQQLRYDNNLSGDDKQAQLDGYDRATKAAIGGFDKQVTNRFRDQFREAFHEGVSAGGDVLDSLADRFKTRLLDGLADKIFDLLGSLNDKTGGGLGNLGKWFAGFFAKGGTIPNGQWGIVGEKGPEPVKAGPNGIQVLPNSALRAAQTVRPASKGGVQVNYYSVNAQGSILASDLLDRISSANGKAEAALAGNASTLRAISSAARSNRNRL